MRRGTIKMGGGVSMRTPLSNRRQAALPLLWEAGFTSNNNTAAEKARDTVALAIRTNHKTFERVGHAWAPSIHDAHNKRMKKKGSDDATV